MMVASAATLTPSISELRTDQLSSQNVSWPSAVVPSRCSPSGSRLRGWVCHMRGSSGANNDATGPTSRTSPTMTLPRMRRLVIASPIADARVEQWINQVDQEGRRGNRDDRKRDRAHQQIVVALQDGGVDQRAEAGIVEYDLGDDRSVEHQAELQGKKGDLGQHGVEHHVAQQDSRSAEALELGIDYEILVHQRRRQGTH